MPNRFWDDYADVQSFTLSEVPDILFSKLLSEEASA